MPKSRYDLIKEKNPREIVLLQGMGCRWKRCRFCDYHQDRACDEATAIALNRKVLQQVSGHTGTLEVINSGSFGDLPNQTVDDVFQLAQNKHLSQLHIECHWQDRDELPALRTRAQSQHLRLQVKTGVETFNGLYRETFLHKGIPVDTSPETLAAHFDECCLLMGLPGQHLEGLLDDVLIGLTHFNRICVNLFINNSTAIKQDPNVAALFRRRLYPWMIDHPRIDVLCENTDFGVG